MGSHGRPSVEAIADGVHHIAGSLTNLYAIEGDGGVTLVDTGYPGDRDLLIASLAELGHTPADVAAVVMTHGHADHLGSAEWLRTTHDAPVHAHAAEEAHLRREHEERIGTGAMLVRLWRADMRTFVAHLLKSKAMALEPVGQVEVFAEAGQPLEVPGGPVPVLTPGHTSGHCSVHLPDRGVLLSGDALVTLDSLTRRAGPRLLDPLFNHDHDQAIRSLDVLAGLDADVVGPGHGEVFRGSPTAAVAAVRASLDRRAS